MEFTVTDPRVPNSPSTKVYSLMALYVIADFAEDEMVEMGNLKPGEYYISHFPRFKIVRDA